MEVEDEIQLADVAEVLVQDLHEGVNQFEGDELVVGFVDDCYEVETGVAFIDDLILFVVDEIAHLGLPGDDELVHLSIEPKLTSFKNLCFSCWDKFVEYHLVSRDRPCLLIRKKQ